MNEFILTHIEDLRETGKTITRSAEIKRMIIEYLNNKDEDFSTIQEEGTFKIYLC